MNFTDAFFLTIIIIAMIPGYRKGFISSVADLAGLMLAMIAGYFLYQPFAVQLKQWFPSLGNGTLLVSLFSIFSFVYIINFFLFRFVKRMFPGSVHKHWGNKLAGIVAGSANGLVIATIIVAIMSGLSMNDTFNKDVKTSYIASVFVTPLNETGSKIFSQGNIFYENVAAANHITKEEETTTLPFTTTDVQLRADLEDYMLMLVNGERAKHGLAALVADTALRDVARAHSEDMFAKGYFSHETPDGKDPFRRMADAHIEFMAAGENLALSRDLLTAHSRLMNSPGHRANILNAAFGRLGIGIVDGGKYGLMISQEFRNP